MEMLEDHLKREALQLIGVLDQLIRLLLQMIGEQDQLERVLRQIGKVLLQLRGEELFCYIPKL
jgi:hypothetical protein